MRRNELNAKRRRARRRERYMSGEKWWPVEWTEVDPDFAEWMPAVSFTRWHPTVKRVMRDPIGVVLEFHARLGRANLNLGKIDDIELRCILLDLAAKWMRNEDNGVKE